MDEETLWSEGKEENTEISPSKINILLFSRFKNMDESGRKFLEILREISQT